MRLVDKLRLVVKTAVSDLFSEGTETAVAPDRTTAVVRQTEAHLNKLENELTQAIVRQKRAETALRVAQAKGQSDVDEFQAQSERYTQVVASLQADIDQLQARLQAVRQRAGLLNEREGSVDARERLQTDRKELDKTAESLHNELDDRQEGIAQREDQAAARDELEEIKRRLQS